MRRVLTGRHHTLLITGAWPCVRSKIDSFLHSRGMVCGAGDACSPAIHYACAAPSGILARSCYRHTGCAVYLNDPSTLPLHSQWRRAVPGVEPGWP